MSIVRFHWAMISKPVKETDEKPQMGRLVVNFDQIPDRHGIDCAAAGIASRIYRDEKQVTIEIETDRIPEDSLAVLQALFNLT